MPHSPTTRAIARYAREAIAQNDPMQFLRKFSPLHNRWHTTSLRNNLGFLLFHSHIKTAFQKCHADQIWPGGVQPFTTAEWTQFQWPYNVNLSVIAGNFDSLAAFSSDIEGWHNEAHMAVELATGEDMMNPLTNIFLKNFWRLHYFIDERFVEALNAFDGKDTTEKQITGLEKKFHTRLGEI